MRLITIQSTIKLDRMISNRRASLSIQVRTLLSKCMDYKTKIQRFSITVTHLREEIKVHTQFSSLKSSHSKEDLHHSREMAQALEDWADSKAERRERVEMVLKGYPNFLITN